MFFIALTRDWQKAELPPHGPHVNAILNKCEFWVGQGRNHSDRFVAIFKKSLLEAAEWIEVLKQAMWKRCQRAESDMILL